MAETAMNPTQGQSTYGQAPGQGRSREQRRLQGPGPLLDQTGRLAQAGYATDLLLHYDRAAIGAPFWRIKEWDYYLVNDDRFAMAFTVSDLAYLSLASVSLMDFQEGSFITKSTMGLLPLGRLGLPGTSREGVTRFADRKAQITYEVAGGMRRICATFQDFKDGQPITAEVVLSGEPRDSMVIATPWADDPRAFYYNQKIVGMDAVGRFTLGGLSHDFQEGSSFGLLDWGRGVWTYDNIWYWAVAQGMQDGRRVAFNLGYGFGDTSAASENMVFVDGIAHKLGRVDFGIPEPQPGAKLIGERFSLMEPWHITDDEGRLDLVFTPQIDRCDLTDLRLIVTDQHQVFGLLNGYVVLDDGTRLPIRDLRGAAEAVHNRY